MSDEKPTFIEWIMGGLMGVFEFFLRYLVEVLFTITFSLGLIGFILSVYNGALLVCFLTFIIMAYSYYRLSWDYVDSGGD